MIDPVKQNKTFNALEDQQMKWLPHHVIKEEKSPLVIISTISMRDIQETLWPYPVSTNQILWQFPQKTNWGEIQNLKTSHHQWTIKLSVKFYPRYGRKCWDSPWKFWGNKIDCLKQFSQKVSCWNCFLHLQCQSWGKKMEILGAKLETDLNQFSSLQCKILPLNLQNVWALSCRLNWGSQSVSFEILQTYSILLKNTQNKWPSFSYHALNICSFYAVAAFYPIILSPIWFVGLVQNIITHHFNLMANPA